MKAVRQFGVEVMPKPTGEILIDMDDVEILSNKLPTTVFEASLEHMVVTLYAKRRQQDNRDKWKIHNLLIKQY